MNWVGKIIDFVMSSLADLMAVLFFASGVFCASGVLMTVFYTDMVEYQCVSKADAEKIDFEVHREVPASDDNQRCFYSTKESDE